LGVNLCNASLLYAAYNVIGAGGGGGGGGGELCPMITTDLSSDFGNKNTIR
jgi:hypothetical protein